MRSLYDNEGKVNQMQVVVLTVRRCGKESYSGKR